MAINYRGTSVARNLGMVAPVRTFGSVTAGNVAVFEDATGRRIKDGGTAVRQQDFSAVPDLAEEPTYDEVVLALRSTLAVLKGAATIALAMLALGAGAQTSRLGSLRAGDVVVTNEQDGLAYPVATNALAVAQSALQPPATNGLLRAEADTLATVTARGGTTTNSVTIGSRGTGNVGSMSLAQGEGAIASGSYSHAEGYSTTASGVASHAEGYSTTASGVVSHAEGYSTTASGYASHAEGRSTTASGDYSHVDGYSTTASGYASHAEGRSTTASGDYSHAEGGSSIASGHYSHAEGYSTTASGYASHADGYSTTASGDYSHAEGFKAIIPDSDDGAFAWQGTVGSFSESQYLSHGPGTFNLNPVGGLAGFWIGETTMDALLDERATWQGATNIAAAAVAGSGHAMAEKVVSGAVCTASAGNRYFWTSATNVVLSVNLTSGQVVNLAKLNNTATNSITAIGQVGWEWTGGDMTNTIAAGKSMTFGFLIDAATGRTNAYATGVSK